MDYLKNGRSKPLPGTRMGWSAYPQTAAFMENVHMDSLFFPLFDSLNDVCFFLKNTSSEMLLCNRQLLQRFNLKSEKSIIGKTDFDLHPHKLAIKYQQDDFYVINSGKPLLKIIEVFPGETGIPGWYMTDKYPVFSKDGDVIGVMGIIQKYAFYGSDGYADGKLGVVLKWIEENINERIDVLSMATIHQLSVRALERMFRQQIGLSPKQYVIRRRIFDACENLRTSQTPLRNIAVDCGFYDQSAFCRAFKHVMGITPQTYRNLYL